MSLNQKQFFEEIDLLTSEGNEILNTEWDPADSGIISFNTYVNYDEYIAWKAKIKNFLLLFLMPDNTYILELDKLEEHYPSHTKACIGILNNIKQQVEKGFITLTPSNLLDVFVVLNIIFSRFHKVARQLRSRYNNRSTLEIEDEYDVQDLLHSLLQLYFDDVRKEEWTPSYAGGSSRQDFLLKAEKVVIEVKKTRTSMKDRDLGEQLIVDIEKYRNHPDCENLICFVYDPEGRLGNPKGIINDLNNKHKGFAEVIIKPD